MDRRGAGGRGWSPPSPAGSEDQGGQDPDSRPSGVRSMDYRSFLKNDSKTVVGSRPPPQRGVGGAPRRSQCALYSMCTGWLEKRAPALTVWSGLQGCRSRCCRRSRWPSSGGRRQRAWRPGASCGPPAVVGPQSPGTGPSPGGAGSVAASLVSVEGFSSPPGKGHKQGIIGEGGPLVEQCWEVVCGLAPY